LAVPWASIAKCSWPSNRSCLNVSNEIETMNSQHIALIVGATGLSGSYAGARLKNAGWTVVTVSRSTVDLPWSDRHIAADLDDAAASKVALSAASDVTNVFIARGRARRTRKRTCGSMQR
jgi:NAD(P)-dependent dehydrogenase (short-subunit alcohol dehydrogenase family)